MKDIKQSLADFVATYNDPKVNGDFGKALGYFPELNGYNRQQLLDYIATVNDPKINGDVDKANKYFPEFFQAPIAPKNQFDFSGQADKKKAKTVEAKGLEYKSEDTSSEFSGKPEGFYLFRDPFETLRNMPKRYNPEQIPLATEQEKEAIAETNRFMEQMILPPAVIEDLNKNKIDVQGPSIQQGSNVAVPSSVVTKEWDPNRLKMWKEKLALDPVGRMYYSYEMQAMNNAEKAINTREKELIAQKNMIQTKADIRAAKDGGMKPEEAKKAVSEKSQKMREVQMELDAINEAKIAIQDYKDGKTETPIGEIIGQFKYGRGTKALIDAATISALDFGKEVMNEKTLMGMDDIRRAEYNKTRATAKMIADSYSANKTIPQEAAGIFRESLPYMTSFMTLGGAAGKLTGKAGIEFVKKSITNGFKKGALTKSPARALGATTDVVDAVLKSAVMSVLSPKTYADAIRYKNGTVGYDIDENAQVVYTGQKDTLSMGEAVLKSAIVNAIENVSEMSGLAFAKIGKKLSPELNKFLKNPKFENSELNNIMKAAGFNGTFNEFLEEQVATPLHAMFDGTAEFSDMFDPRQQLITLLGVAMPGAGFAMTGYGMNKARQVQAKAKYKVARANMFSELYSGGNVPVEALNTLSDDILPYTKPEDMVQAVTDFLGGTELTEKQKDAVDIFSSAVGNYMANSPSYRKKLIAESEQKMQIMDDIKSLHPELNEEQLSMATYFQSKINKLEGKKGVADKNARKIYTEELNKILGITEAETIPDKNKVVIDQIESELEKIQDDETVSIRVKSMDEIPDQFKDRAKEVGGQDVKIRKTFLGIPYGSESVSKLPVSYVYTATGLEIKEQYKQAKIKQDAIQKSSTEESVLRNEQPQVGLQEMGERNAQEQATTEEIKQKEITPEVVVPEEETAPVISEKLMKSAGVTLPETKIIVADNALDAGDLVYSTAIESGISEEEAGQMRDTIVGDSGGYTIMYKGKPFAVVVDRAQANSRTLGHELWHPLLSQAFNDNEAEMAKFVSQIDKKLRDAGYTDIANKLKTFAAKYKEEGLDASEYMAEFGGYLSDEMANLERLGNKKELSALKKFIQSIKDYINKLSKKLIGKEVFAEKATEEDIVSLMMATSKQMKAGEKAEFKPKTEAKKEEEEEYNTTSVKTEEAESKSGISFSYLDGGFLVNNKYGNKESNYYAFDVRSDEKIMDLIYKNKPFISTTSKNDKEYLVVGIKVDTKESKTLGRDGFVFATKELGEDIAENVIIQEAINSAKALGFEDIQAPIITRSQKAEGKKRIPSFVDIKPGIDSIIEDFIKSTEGRKVLKKGEISSAMNEAISYVKSTKYYSDLSDDKKEKTINKTKRYFRTKAVINTNLSKLTGDIEDIANIKSAEASSFAYAIIKGAMEAKTILKARKVIGSALIKELRDYIKKGKISQTQALNAINRFNKTNLFNEVSVNAFVEYVKDVFNKSEMSKRLADIDAKRKDALKAADTKLGASPALIHVLRKILPVKASMMPSDQLDSFEMIVNVLSANKAVLDLPDIDLMNELSGQIYDALNKKFSLIGELRDMFAASENLKYDENGKLDFLASITAMKEAGEVSESDFDFMKQNRGPIVGELADKREPKTDEEKEFERLANIEYAKTTQIDESKLELKEDREAARLLSERIQTSGVNSLNYDEAKKLASVVDNINNGYFPHTAQILSEKIVSHYRSVPTEERVSTGDFSWTKKAYSTARNFILRSTKTASRNILDSMPKSSMDMLLGFMKGKTITNNTVYQIAQGYAKFRAEYDLITHKLDNAMYRISKKYKYDNNDVVAAKMRMMTYMLQREFETNVINGVKDNKNNQVTNPVDIIDATIEYYIKNSGSIKEWEKTIDVLNDIKYRFLDHIEGIPVIDAKKMYDSFSNEEKRAIEIFAEISKKIEPLATFASSTIRGTSIKPINNWIHHITLTNDTLSEKGLSDVQEMSKRFDPSTKAGSFIERDGKVHPMNFDVFSAVSKGAKGVLMDYYLTVPIRESRRTMRYVNDLLTNRYKNEIANENKNATENHKRRSKIFEAINSGIEGSIRDTLTNAYMYEEGFDKFMSYMQSAGYKAMLASSKKFFSELTANFFGATAFAPEHLAEGLSDPKLRKLSSSNSGIVFMNNINAVQQQRLYPSMNMDSKWVDSSQFKKTPGTGGSRMMSDAENTAAMIAAHLTRRLHASADMIADLLISTPDKVIARPVFFGAFQNEFKKITGEKPDIDKILENDEAYMLEFKDAIEEASKYANYMSIRISATSNPFLGIAKNMRNNKDRGFMVQMALSFNRMFTGFLTFEYAATSEAIRSILAGPNNSELTRKRAAMLLAAVVIRGTIYTFLMQTLGHMINSMWAFVFGAEGKDDDEEKGFDKTLAQAFLNYFSSVILGRSMGQIPRGFMSYGIETANREYFDFLREEGQKYDTYRDAITMGFIPNRDDIKGKNMTLEIMQNAMGPLSPMAKAVSSTALSISRTQGEKQSTRERGWKELKFRTPIELMGVLGFVPMYRDIREMVLAGIYKDIKKKKKGGEIEVLTEKEIQELLKKNQK